MRPPHRPWISAGTFSSHILQSARLTVRNIVAPLESEMASGAFFRDRRGNAYAPPGCGLRRGDVCLTGAGILMLPRPWLQSFWRVLPVGLYRQDHHGLHLVVDDRGQPEVVAFDIEDDVRRNIIHAAPRCFH